MEKSKKPYRYFSKLIHNSNINEYRQNDNAEKYITPVGDDLYEMDQDDESEVKSEDSIERLLVMQNPQNWLLFMDNKELQKALKRLSPDDLEFIFLMHVKDYTQAEMAATYHKSQATISKHYKVILKKLKKLFENGYKKQGVMCL